MSERRTILVVDDAPESASILAVACSRVLGANVLTVPNGAAAWSFLSGDLGRDVGVVVTDLDMPGMDGYELLSRVRESPNHVSIPVVVISATSDQQAAERVLKLGANAFFPKPWSPAKVRDKLEQLLHYAPDSLA